MTKDLEALTALPERFVLEGKGFRIKPHSPLVMAKINKHFKTDEISNGYQYAIDEYSQGNWEVAAEFIYLCLDKCPPEVGSMDKFKKLILEDNKDPNLINQLFALCIKDASADFAFEGEDSKKKVAMGLIIWILAILGLMHTLFWLFELASPYLSSSTSLLDKFNGFNLL